MKKGFNRFTAKSPSITQSTTALCSILQLLMQGYEKDPPSIDNPTRWSDSTLDFSHSLISATELTTVIQVGGFAIWLDCMLNSTAQPPSEYIRLAEKGREACGARAVLEQMGF